MMAVDGHRAVAQQLADQLTDGFLALSGEYQLLREQHRQLEEQLSWAKKQHQEILRRFVPDTADDEFALYLDDLVEAGKGTRNGQSDWLEILSQNPSDGRSGRAFLIRQAELAIETLKNIAEAKEPLGVKIWSGPSADREPQCQVSGTVNGAVNGNIHSPLEKDFTVPGPPSKLGCPFAKSNGLPTSQSEKNSLATPRSSMSKLSPLARRSMRSSFHDPIRAEINGIQDVLSAPSIEGSTTGICPIRFLDQHSPEEVAQYFENHKHEIPRSHEICIKRFQSNADQVRQLDAKYGNMVSMIQGLGQKHQPMLPEKPAEEEDDEVIQDEQDEASDKVKNWAEEVNASLADGETGNPHGDIDPAPEQDEEDVRESRFDRTLKEVRVGESPSRPWGITVPAKYAKTAEVSSTRSPATASPLEEPQTIRPSGCPFDHTKLQARVSDLPDIDTPKPERATSPLKANHVPLPPADGPTKIPVYGEAPRGAAPVPQMVFTGPVFIGYSPELIQQFMAQGVGKTA